MWFLHNCVCFCLIEDTGCRNEGYAEKLEMHYFSTSNMKSFLWIQDTVITAMWELFKKFFKVYTLARCRKIATA